LAEDENLKIGKEKYQFVVFAIVLRYKIY